MPYNVIEKTTVDRLRIGAVLPDYGDQVVRDIRRKVKYAMVDIAPSKDSDDVTTDLRWPLTHEVNVTVEKLTEDERRERDLRFAQTWAQRQYDDGLADVPADLLSRYAQAWHDGPYKGRVLDWSEASTFFTVQEQYRMWQDIKATFERLSEVYGADEITPMSAIVLELEQREHDRQNRGVSSPLSRSTNLLSNMFDDMQRYVWDALADDSRYHLSNDIRKDEMARLETLRAARKARENDA